MGFVKCTSCVKYASRVKYACGRVGDLFNFTSHAAVSGVRYFTIYEVNYFTFGIAEYFT